MISANRSAHKPTRNAMSEVLRLPVGLPSAALPSPAMPASMVRTAPMNVATMTYENGCVNMKASLGRLRAEGKPARMMRIWARRVMAGGNGARVGA